MIYCKQDPVATARIVGQNTGIHTTLFFVDDASSLKAQDVFQFENCLEKCIIKSLSIKNQCITVVRGYMDTPPCRPYEGMLLSVIGSTLPPPLKKKVKKSSEQLSLDAIYKWKNKAPLDIKPTHYDKEGNPWAVWIPSDTNIPHWAKKASEFTFNDSIYVMDINGLSYWKTQYFLEELILIDWLSLEKNMGIFMFEQKDTA